MLNFTMPKPEFENTINFVGRVVAPLTRSINRLNDPRHYFPVKSRNHPHDEWVRNWEITGLYLGTDKTLEEIGAKFHLTRARIQQIVKKNLFSLYQSSDEQIKSGFPWESLETSKPLSIASRKRLSLASGGISVRAEELVKRGLSAGEIQAALNTTSSQLGVTRHILNTWGTELPYQNEAYSPNYRQNLARLFAGTLPYEEAQRIIDQVTRGVLQKHSSGDKPDLLSVITLAQKSGLSVNTRKVSLLVKILRGNQIPTGLVEHLLSEKPGRKSYVIHYYIIPSYYQEKAKNILQSHPELASFRDNPVSVIGKKSPDIPNTSQLKNSGIYKSVGVLLGELGYPRFLQHAKLTTGGLITSDCPVSVFAQRNRNFYYRADDEEALRALLLSRLAELKT